MAIKGYNGAFKGTSAVVPCVIKWELDQVASPNPAPNSATKNQANELEGVTDFTGSYVAHGHTPASDPGDALSFAATLDQDVDANMTADGTAMVESWRIDWDYANNAPITHMVKFGANGTAITYGSTAVEDSSAPAWFMSNDTAVTGEGAHGSVQLGTPIATPVYSDLAGVVAASLYCWGEIEPYCNSSTGNKTARAMGNLQWMVDLAVHVSATNALEGPNNVKAIKLFATTSKFWEAKWVNFTRVGPLEVEVAGRKLVTIQYRGMGVGWWDGAVAGTFVEGALTNPATTKVWVHA